MKRDEMDTLQKKVEELRAVLLFGKRALPFLEDIFAFVQEIIPVVEELKASVDSTSEKLPRASKQLDKVTHATETASTEILNTLETMFGKLEGMMADRTQQQVRMERVERTTCAIDAALHMLTADPAGQGGFAQLRKAWEEHRTAVQSSFGDDGVQTLQGLQSDCTNIMMALQVQDITAQQIAGVNRLMQSVDEGLNKLMKHFSEVPASADQRRFDHAHLDIQFDESAEYLGAEDRQKTADALVESTRQATDAGRAENT